MRKHCYPILFSNPITVQEVKKLCSVHNRWNRSQIFLRTFPIIAVLKEGEAGAKLADLCRKYGMSSATYYNWKSRYAGLSVSELRRLKALEEENRRLKQIVADQALDNRALKELLSKNF